MIRVRAYAQGGTAYQYLPETAESLKGLETPAGPITVQFANELNRTPGRCYVPTTWGSAVLEEGDWFVVYDVGVVSAFTKAQFSLLFEADYSDSGDTLFSLNKLESGVMQEPLFSDVEEAVPTVPTEEVVPVFKATVLSDGSSWLPAFERYCMQYRLDFVILSEDGIAPTRSIEFRIVANATGREVLRFEVGDTILGYSNGEMGKAGYEEQ